MIRIIKDDNLKDFLTEMKARSFQTGLEVNKTVSAILEDVRVRGLEAVNEYSRKFDKSEVYELSREDLDKAAAECPPDLLQAMRLSAANIQAYQSRLLTRSWEWNTGRSVLGQRVRGLTKVGIYVPGGTAAYPSSVLMTAVPAKVAGVEEIIMVTPPTENLNAAVMAAAKIAGVDRVIAVGGAQAVAALAYGAGFIPKADKIVGPGNAYVAAAKRMAYGNIDIDMIAGPSEILIIADGGANPVYIAADMLAQLEHDRLAGAILLTTSDKLAEEVSAEMERQLQYLSRRGIIESSLRDFGAIVVCDSLERACQISDEIAPEHLEILTDDPKSLLPYIKNAGAIFLGEYSPEALGDYMAGPSHVLPTGGTAGFFSPLSAESFLKKTSVISYSKEDLLELREGIETFADAEGLTAHANSINVRFGKYETADFIQTSALLQTSVYRRNADAPARMAELIRQTKETNIAFSLDLNGSGVQVSTGIGFFDHMLTSMFFYAGFGVSLNVSGDLHVDGHHTVEDTGIVIGQALKDALGDKTGIRRFASAYVPMDEALCFTALDFSGRAYLVYDAPLEQEIIQGYDSALTEEFMRAFAVNAGLTLHQKAICGKNSHHIIEGLYKSLGLALKDAVKITGGGVSSTKGVLE